MLFISLQIVGVGAVIAGAVALGYQPTLARWGDAGIAEIWPAAIICGGAALISAIPILICAFFAPKYVLLAGIGGTTVRLLLTMIAGVTYQVVSSPQLTAFLTWLVVFYLLLLVVETVLALLVGWSVGLKRPHEEG